LFLIRKIQIKEIEILDVGQFLSVVDPIESICTWQEEGEFEYKTLKLFLAHDRQP
jgi:hypothetical protein